MKLLDLQLKEIMLFGKLIVKWRRSEESTQRRKEMGTLPFRLSLSLFNNILAVIREDIPIWLDIIILLVGLTVLAIQVFKSIFIYFLFYPFYYSKLFKVWS